MSPLAKLRVSTLACALFFSVSTAAQPAFAEVLISVNKSTQQMSVSADGVPRYRFAVSTGRAGYGHVGGRFLLNRMGISAEREARIEEGKARAAIILEGHREHALKLIAHIVEHGHVKEPEFLRLMYGEA